MAKYIDKQAAIEQIKTEWAKLPLTETTGFGILMRVLTSLPAADVRPVVLGKWEHFGSDVFRCSECGYGIQPWNVGVNFCPNCGCAMEDI